MKTHYTLNVQLTLVGPILTAGGETSDPGVDTPMARDRFRRFMLPFSLIKGKVLDALRDLGTPSDQLKQLLGVGSSEGQFEPERGRLHFSDFYTEQEGNPDHVIDRIQIDAESGSVKGRMLQMVQAPFGYGEAVTFVGKVEFVADQQEADAIKSLVDEGLRWVPSYGANRTVGFGRTQSVKTDLAPTSQRSVGNPITDDVLPFRISLDRPLCLVGRKHEENHFDSLETISGSVLKGAVARMLQELVGIDGRDVSGGNGPGLEFGTVRKYFDKIRFAEARPQKVSANASAMKRPVEPPLSIVTCPTESMQGRYFDAALEEQPKLIDGTAPAFMPDWKDDDFGLVRGEFGWPELRRERRTRTAINPQTARAADEQLFSYGLVQPDFRDEDGSGEACVWESRIGLENIPDSDQQPMREALQALLQFGITGIGKTRAVGSIEWLAAATTLAMQPSHSTSDTIVVTLETDCLMTNPNVLEHSGDDPLYDAYQDFWSEVSEGALRMKRFFARQSLHGGYVSRRVNTRQYEPFLLTDRGSVFVLCLKDEATARLLLERWNKHGLPTPQWVSDRYAPNGEGLWQQCPYLPENGYGEIEIDLACHRDNRFPPADKTGVST